MSISRTDRETLRRLAERYSAIAHQPIQMRRLDRYYATQALQAVRPVVLIDEVPWGEINDPALVNRCNPAVDWLETHLRRTLYQWEHFQVDRVVPPVFAVPKRIRQVRDIGMQVHNDKIRSQSGSYAVAQAYHDQLATDEDLATLREPRIECDHAASEQALAVAGDIFDGLMPVKQVGCPGLQTSLWDRISTLRGVENLLTDLVVRPDFMHRTVRRFMEIAQAEFKQLEDQALLDPSPLLLHCTPACTRDLPAADFAGHVRACDVWGRCAAQIFGSVSPAMHDEFDLAYNQILFENCGLLYYGCCEPMDLKIDLLRKRFKNLRKISITPWADPRRAAEAIGGDYVMAAKPNPGFVAGRTFNPEPVIEEISRYCEASRQYGVTLEFVLKDISTIANQTANLTQWATTVKGVIDRFFPDDENG